ncbi:MAG: hypothetical protein AB7O24_16580 [Kofleriaceae bacterium]
MRHCLLVLVVALAACKDAPSQAQCQQLLDHLVNLELDNAGANNSETVKAELAKQKQAVASAKAEEFLNVCMNKTARARVECALAAKDRDAVAKCDEAND